MAQVEQPSDEQLSSRELNLKREQLYRYAKSNIVLIFRWQALTSDERSHSAIALNRQQLSDHLNEIELVESRLEKINPAHSNFFTFPFLHRLMTTIRFDAIHKTSLFKVLAQEVLDSIKVLPTNETVEIDAERFLTAYTLLINQGLIHKEVLPRSGESQ